MPSMTRRTARSETRDGQSSPQGDGIGVGSTQGPTEPSSSGTVHNSEVDVHQPMTLRQMQDIVDNQLLSTEQLRILSDRIRELLDARTGQLGKRTRFESDGEDDRPRKRRADHDLKYNNIKELKIGATLKAWSDWKIEIQRAFDAAPYKYDNDRTKVIKALSHLDEDSKTLWNNYILTNPEDEYDWEAFLVWLDTTIRDQGNDEVTIQIEWSKARQKFDQTPWAFDAYLTSLEREMEPKGERTRAMELFSRLRPSLRRAIRLSGVNPLPQTRQAMLSLATRMWEEIKYDEKDPRKERKPFEWKPAPRKDSSTAPQAAKLHQSSRRSNNGENHAEPKAENKLERPRGPKEYASGKNENGQRVCYTCGSTEHLSSYHKRDNHHRKDDKGDTEQKKPGVHVVKATSGRKKGHERVAEKVWNLTDSSSDSENE
jgi:hypothetical protein